MNPFVLQISPFDMVSILHLAFNSVRFTGRCSIDIGGKTYYYIYAKMKLLKFVLILIITIGLLYFFFKNEDFGKILNIIKNVNPIYPLIFILGSIGQFFIRGYRWGLILKPYKNKIRLLTLYNFTVIGYFINTFVPGRGGEAAKAILLAREEKIKQSYGLASVVLERMIDVFMMVVLFLTSLLFFRHTNLKILSDLKTITLYLLPIFLIIFLLFYFINSKRIFVFIERIILKISGIFPAKIRDKIAGFLLYFIKGLRLNLNLLDFFKLFLSSLIVWIFAIPFFWFLMKGFNIHIGLLETVPYFCIILIAAAIPTPGMAGSLDAGSKLALTQLYDISTETAVAYTLGAHFLILLTWIVFGIIALSMQRLNFSIIKGIKKKKNEMS
jgi:uncharacterized protein (TIRG00374 family)